MARTSPYWCCSKLSRLMIGGCHDNVSNDCRILFQGNWFSPIFGRLKLRIYIMISLLTSKDQLFGTAKELGQVELFVPATPWLVSANLLGKHLQSSAWITSTVGSVEAEWPHFAKEKKLGLGFLRGNVSETVVVFGRFPQHPQNLVWFLVQVVSVEPRDISFDIKFGRLVLNKEPHQCSTIQVS